MTHKAVMAKLPYGYTVYPKKYAHGFVVLCFVVAMQSFIMNSHEVFIHIHQGFFAGTGAIVRLPQCQWSKLDGYGKISQCITTTKHSKAKTVCIFLGIYCTDIVYTANGHVPLYQHRLIKIGKWINNYISNRLSHILSSPVRIVRILFAFYYDLAASHSMISELIYNSNRYQYVTDVLKYNVFI